MEDEEIQEGPVATETIGIEDQDPDVSLGMDRRDFLRSGVSSAIMLAMVAAGVRANAQEAADEFKTPAWKSETEAKSDPKEQERQAAYEKVRKEGLARIERKENYAIKFDGRFKGGHDILVVRFKEGKSGIIILIYAGEKLLEKKQFDVNSYSVLLDGYKKRGFQVSELN
ncbi:MAG: hypothetical protein O3B47_04000 [bacterium]|nr:hypothetical protein [bacterium]